MQATLERSAMFLTGDEIEQLTGKKRPGAQQKALNQMGVPFKTRADGHTLVLSSVVNQLLGASSKQKERGFTLNLSHA